ncbi:MULTISPECIES: HutD family protein [Streptomyces]|uniref:HutD/Ves family protein n=1 Tax=Streptomyces TaxID=1883 RepID=UPI0005265D1D|nr:MULTISPECIES: HutD family protein [Streptomyces]
MTTSEPFQVLRASERPATAWLNGGGVTREIAGFPAGAGLEKFDWRVSLADVASAGPFSPFPGIDRVITLVEGTGMALTVDGVEQLVDAPYRPFAFSGDATTDCRLLGGPVVDFNVMTRRGRVEATVDLLSAPADIGVPAGGTALLVCLAGSALISGSGGSSADVVGVGDVELARYDAALLAAPGTHRLRPDGVTAAITFRPTR